MGCHEISVYVGIDLEGTHQVRPNHVGLVRLSAELPAARTAETLGGIF